MEIDLPSLITALGGIIAGMLGAIVTWRKASGENRVNLTTRIEEQMLRQDKRIETLEARERILTEYIFELQVHISAGKPPPPPKWPTALLPPPPTTT